jgi:hypothetical protein
MAAAVSGQHRACPICGGHLRVHDRGTRRELEHCDNSACPFGNRERARWAQVDEILAEYSAGLRNGAR